MWKSLKTKRLALLIPQLMLLSLLGACVPNAQHIDATAVQEGKALVVSGTSNLPDQTFLVVALVDPSQPTDMNKDVIVQEFVLVKDGAFKVTLTPWQPLAAGKYQLRVRFDPNSYDPSKGAVSAELGPKGEKLVGNQVVQQGDVKMLETKQEIEYKP